MKYADKANPQILTIATTKLCTDGLTEMLIEIAKAISNRCSVSFALDESVAPDVLEKLTSIGQVWNMPSRRKQPVMYMLALYRLMKRKCFDCVHIHGNSATMAIDLFPAYMAGIATRITHVHNCAKQSFIKQQTLGRILNKLVTNPVACSKAAGKMLYHNRFTVITNGIDCTRFSFSAESRHRIRQELHLENMLVIGHIGRFSKQKNHLRLLRIFAAVLKKQPNSRLLLCGSGENEPLCREEAKKAGMSEKILFLGEVTNPEDYLSAMDVFVLPSLFEGLPLVGVEAQASGLPCVFSDKITEEAAILNTSQFLSLSESDDVWAEAILCCHPGDRSTAAANANAAGYDRQKMYAQVTALYGI